jgi:transmembrane sensor
MTPDDASAYFVSHEADDLTPGEQSLLAEWLAADDAHAAAYHDAKQAWMTLDGADQHEIFDAMLIHVRQSRSRRMKTRFRLFAIAAMLVLVATTSLFFASPYRSTLVGKSGAVAAEPEWTRIASIDGATRAVSLDDGTLMTLDVDSLAFVRFLPGERSIRLMRGRAFFDVAKDVARPFAVAAAGRRVTALGTRFEVDTNGGILRVSLFRGKVGIRSIADGRQNVFLDPGQQFLEEGGRVSVLPINAGDANGPPWLNGLIRFYATPLGEAVQEVNRYSRTKIRVSDPGIAALHVTGAFRAGNADRFAQTIADAYPVTVVRGHNEIEMVSRK